MQPVEIKLDGFSRTIELGLEFDPEFVSTRDWLVRVELYYQGDRIDSDDIGWDFSPAVNANFAYLIKTAGVSRFLPRPIICSVPFDEVKVDLLPWSADARGTASAPKIRQCRYAVRSQILTGEDMRMESHVLGSVVLAGES